MAEHHANKSSERFEKLAWAGVRVSGGALGLHVQTLNPMLVTSIGRQGGKQTNLHLRTQYMLIHVYRRLCTQHLQPQAKGFWYCLPFTDEEMGV